MLVSLNQFPLISLDLPTFFREVRSQIRISKYTLATLLRSTLEACGRVWVGRMQRNNRREEGRKKKCLACLRNRDRARPKFTLRQCTRARRLPAPETALVSFFFLSSSSFFLSSLSCRFYFHCVLFFINCVSLENRANFFQRFRVPIRGEG